MTTAHVCLEAQGVISAAFDGEIPDQAALESAKAHCHACAECAGFVGLLAEMRRLPAPEIPAPVLDRTLAAIADEAAASAPAPAATVSPADEDSGDAPVAPDRRPPGADTRDGSARPQWRAWAPWAAAAALFFVAAGVLTAQGVRFLLSPTPTSTVSETATLQESGSISRDTAAQPDEAAPAPGSPDAEVFSGPGPVTGPAYVTLNDRVFRYDAPTDLPPGAPSSGTLTSALGTGMPATQRPVFDDPASDAVIVAEEDGTYLRFVPVTRTFQGRAYALRSQPITAFGVWPSLPAAIPQPSSPEGTPELVPAGTDDAGVRIFIRPGTDPSSGLAIAPGTSSADAAGGNPGWTWWVPVGQ